MNDPMTDWLRDMLRRHRNQRRSWTAGLPEDKPAEEAPSGEVTGSADGGPQSEEPQAPPPTMDDLLRIAANRQPRRR